MRFEGSNTVRAPREQVWAALNDPEVLARCVPGVKNLRRDEAGTLHGALELAVGPLKGTYQGRVTPSALAPPEHMALQLEARAPVGLVRARGELRLDAQEGATVVHWSGTPQLSGMLAALGGRLVGSAVRQQADAFFGKLEAEARRYPASSSGV